MNETKRTFAIYAPYDEASQIKEVVHKYVVKDDICEVALDWHLPELFVRCTWETFEKIKFDLALEPVREEIWM